MIFGTIKCVWWWFFALPLNWLKLLYCAFLLFGASRRCTPCTSRFGINNKNVQDDDFSSLPLNWLKLLYCAFLLFGASRRCTPCTSRFGINNKNVQDDDFNQFKQKTFDQLVYINNIIIYILGTKVIFPRFHPNS